MISSLRRSEASARSAIARSCALSLVTASCSAADSSAVSMPPSFIRPRVSRAAVKNFRTANVSDGDEHRHDRGQAEEQLAGRRHVASEEPEVPVEDRVAGRRRR